MRLMAASDDLRFQCYLMEGEADSEVFALGVHGNQAEFFVSTESLCDEEERYFLLWDALTKSVVGKEIIWFRPNLPVRFTGIEISEHCRGQRASMYLHQACIRYMQELGFEGGVQANIDKDKIPSMKAALRVGFRQTTDNHNYFTLARNIESLQSDEGLQLARELITEEPKPRVENW